MAAEYLVRIWCDACFEDDMLGCFDGGYHYINAFDVSGDPKVMAAWKAFVFKDKAWAKAAGKKYLEKYDCDIWHYEIIEKSTAETPSDGGG